MPAECTAELNAICDGIAAEERRVTLSRVRDRLHKLVDADDRTSPMALVLTACAYRSETPGGNNPFSCDPYFPLFVSQPGEDDFEPWPWKLDEAPDRAVEVWRSHARDAGLHPIVRARMADLLWVRGDSESTQLWHRAAVEAYLEAAEGDADDMECVDGLVRAYEVTRESNQPALQSSVLDALCAMAEAALSAEDGPYGVVIRALRTLCDGGRECINLIEQALDAFGGVHWKAVELNRLAASQTSDRDRRSYELAQIAAMETAASHSTGLLRFKLLEEAVRLAELLGYPEETGRLRVLLEQVDVANEMKTIHIETPIDQENLDMEIERIVGNDDLASALQRLCERPPTGDAEQNRAFLNSLLDGAPSASIVPETAIGAYNSASTTSPGTSAREETELGQYEAHGIGIFASLVGLPALRQIASHYRTSQDDVTGIFESEFISRELAERVARAFERWTSDDHISAVSVLVLCIEPIVREIAHQFGIAVTKNAAARSVTTSELRPLGALLSDLEAHIGASWTRYYRAALSNPDAWNFRNAATHGIVPRFTQEQFVILFHIACALRMNLRISERQPGPQGDPSEASVD